MKKLTIGIIIGLMLGISTNAFAAIGDSVTAVFAQFSYVVNGTGKTIDSPVLVYEGTSYLRTTDIANMLGFDVTYKADSRTIEFNKPETVYEPIETVQPTPIPIQQAPMVEGTPTVEGETQTITPTPTPEPSATPTPTPVPDNTAQCLAIDEEYVMKIWTAEQTNKKTEAHYLKYYYEQAKINAGC